MDGIFSWLGEVWSTHGPVSIGTQDLMVIGFLVFLEGILSIDNALVLAMMARHLPPAQQRKALTYGLIGAIVFRLIALGMVTQLMRWTWVKFVGGGYLLFLAGKYGWSKLRSNAQHAAGASSGKKVHGFWMTVLMIELMDIAFAVDSILAAVALSNKFWIVFLGGIIGVIIMRFAATGFITLLKRFPGFEDTAYLLIGLIGFKVILEACRFESLDFHSPSHPSFWVFWGLMIACIAFGFRPKRESAANITPPPLG